ncbi:MAG: AMP nucleosidase [Pseudomonadota bacterium]
MMELSHTDTASATLDRLEALYNDSLVEVARRLASFAKGGTIDVAASPTYPYLQVKVPARSAIQTSSLALGRVAAEQEYGATMTQPSLFRNYLSRELNRLKDEFGAKFFVGPSDTPIPLSFALEEATAALSPEQKQDLPRHFHMPNLVTTNDEIVDGRLILRRDGPGPLSMFTAERVDYSLHRIQHYTATAPKHFQNFVLFTNYQRYVDEFKEHALKAIASGEMDAFVEPGNLVTTKSSTPDPGASPKPPQMPAYHLTKNGHDGITLVNIGVGPSNAKTITDHIAVLRPHVWLMVGHCGGLRRTQRLGDYVLAHAYLRDDRVLDDVLDPSVPLPTIAEVQLALTQAVSETASVSGAKVKEFLRTGTIVTTADRNWELRFEQMAVRLNQSRAIAIDMESATIAANGYRYRVPYGTLLCVSDRPLHGELKLPGMADAFYQERVSQHLAAGLRAVDLLRAEAAANTLHSRKLRSFDEPLLR